MPLAVSPRTHEHWQSRGACRSTDLTPDAWFPISGAEPETKAARALCHQCLVRLNCIQESLLDPETVGIWGGFDEFERSSMEP